MHNGEHTKRTRWYLNQALTDDQCMVMNIYELIVALERVGPGKAGSG